MVSPEEMRAFCRKKGIPIVGETISTEEAAKLIVDAVEKDMTFQRRFYTAVKLTLAKMFNAN